MFQRKLIVVLGLVAALVASAGVSQASLARVEGMNLIPSTSSLSSVTLTQFTDDYVNIYMFPTSVVRQNNLVLAELGNNPGGFSDDGMGFSGEDVSTFDQSMTLIRNFPRFGAIAFQMKQNALNDQFSNNLTHEQLDLIWGRGFEKIDLAARLDITSSRFESSTSTGGVTSSFENLGDSFNFSGPYPFGSLFEDAIAGTGVELNTFGLTPAIAIHMQNEDRVEGAFTYRTYSLDRSESNPSPAVNEKWEDGGNASYAVMARAIIHRGGNHVWYPAAMYSSADLSWEVTNAGGVSGVTRSADETYKTYGVGIADNMQVNDNNTLIWGVAVGQRKHEYTRGDDNTGGGPTGGTKSLEETDSYFPLVFAAVETQATNWLKVRMGASRGRFTSKFEETSFGTPATTDVDESLGSDFAFSLGTGIRWNNLDIDMTLNEQFPLSGGYILSGDRSTPFTRASATYHF